MALILCIETATEVCSVALFRDGITAGIKESTERNGHSALLTTFIEDVVSSSGNTFSNLDAIAVSMGPGSYTGLRIGVATAKGLCYALEKPLIAVPTLQAMAAGIVDKLRSTKYEVRSSAGGSGDEHQTVKLNEAILVCPMIDARRMEVYCAVYSPDGREVREVRAEIIDESSFGEFLAVNRMIFGGEGAEKCTSVLGGNPNAFFTDDFRASARFMGGFAAEKFRQNQFENLAYFEPFYLKDFVAGKPRVKGLHLNIDNDLRNSIQI